MDFTVKENGFYTYENSSEISVGFFQQSDCPEVILCGLKSKCNKHLKRDFCHEFVI